MEVSFPLIADFHAAFEIHIEVFVVVLGAHIFRRGIVVIFCPDKTRKLDFIHFLLEARHAFIHPR